MSNYNTNKALDMLVADLKIALKRLDSSKKCNLSNVFSHVRKSCLGEYQKDWELSCIRQLAEIGFIIFDETDGAILLMPQGVSHIIKDSDKIWVIVTKAYDAATGSSIWDEVKSEPISFEQPTKVGGESSNEFSLDTNRSYNYIEDLNINDDDDPKLNNISVFNETITDDIEPSWDTIDHFFDNDQKEILFHIKKVMNQLASGDELSRPDLFADSYPVGVTLQKSFLSAAIHDGLLGEKGERRGHKYFLSKGRNDHDSFELLTRLVYPNLALSVHNEIETDQVQESDEPREITSDQILDRIANILTYQSTKINDQSAKIEALTEAVNNLTARLNGK